MNKSGISIVLCCYNSKSRIAKTLTYISKLKITHLPDFEVILVDNNSSDNTVSVAKEVWRRNNTKIKLQIVKEKKQGLSHARIKGVENSNFEYIIFCDDDNWLNEDYAQTAFFLMEEHSQIGVLGGFGIPASNKELPKWFEACKASYAVGPQADKTGDISARGFVWGAGMVIRKSVWLRIISKGARSLLSGRCGGKILSGDDSEICKWYLLEGFSLFYSSDLQFKHFIPDLRLTEVYRNNLHKSFRLAQPTLDAYQYIVDLKNRGVRTRSSFAVFGILKLCFFYFYDREMFYKYRKELQVKVGNLLILERPLYDLLTVYGHYLK